MDGSDSDRLAPERRRQSASQRRQVGSDGICHVSMHVALLLVMSSGLHAVNVNVPLLERGLRWALALIA